MSVHALNTRPCADTDHTFTSTATDWGFTTFMLLSELHNPEAGFLDENQDFKIRVTVKASPRPCTCTGGKLSTMIVMAYSDESDLRGGRWQMLY